MSSERTHAGVNHVPVLLREVVTFVKPRVGGVYVDGTFGSGGYTTAILETADCRVVGIDRDPAAINNGITVINKFPGRLILVKGNFGKISNLLAQCSLAKVDGIVLDLGVSALQISTPERGFSFQTDGPLDMRMDYLSSGLTASDVINTFSEAKLTHILRKFGEEKRAHRIARFIVAARPIKGSAHLVKVVGSATGSFTSRKLNPATRTFQALRMFINDEQRELEQVLVQSEDVLVPGGCIVVVSFHSLEDRAVKHFFQRHAGYHPRTSRYYPEAVEVKDHAPTFYILTRHAVRPNSAEIVRNPSARSAKLRAARRI